jgi:membrane associated rhomboid family serine protease
MLLPIRTNVESYRVPYTNYALIAVNVIVFLITYVGGEQNLRGWASGFMLTPAYPFLWQFITYAFLHGSFGHIFGNMYFLYIFGNNVNDRLGHLGYLCFYLAGAIFSAIGHILIASFHGSIATPVLGASGAIAAVTGAYLVLFPQTLITIIYWFFIIGTMEVPAIFLILFKMIFIDNIIARSAQNVAYDAHLAGYAFGILSILLFLIIKIIPRDQFDLWAMITRWNKRREYSSTITEDNEPFPVRMSRKIKVKDVTSEEQQKAEDASIAIKHQIYNLISQGNLASAAQLYLDSRDKLTGALPKQTMLDIANQLMSAGQWPQAAEAYEKFLSLYGSYEHTEQVQLMLGIIYSRYIVNKEKALDYLKKAAARLSDDGQKRLCENEIRKIGDNS